MCVTEYGFFPHEIGETEPQWSVCSFPNVFVEGLCDSDEAGTRRGL